MNATILVVEDEPDALELVRYNLRQAGYGIATAEDGAQALAAVKKAVPDLILLDVMLPQMDGLELCKLFRNSPATASVPIIMLTARASELDRVLGLELGADDYVTKPFSPRELLLRIKKLLERSRAAAIAVDRGFFHCGNMTVDVPAHLVKVDEQPVALTATEFKLLHVLLQRRGLVQSRERLLREVWEYDKMIETRTVDTHVRRLRDKLGPAANFIETIRGVGYRFAAD